MARVQISLKAHGLERALKRTARLLSLTRNDLEEAMTELSRKAAWRSKLNAPILTGALRRSIRPIPLKGETTKIFGGVKTGDLPYALKMHEGEYNLGPVSAAQPMTREGGVGRKFITRVFNYMLSHREYENLLREKWRKKR